MALPKLDFIVGSAILIYFATFITEIVSSVPVGLVVNDFRGNCILSAKVEYVSTRFDEGVLVKSFGNKAMCIFCTYLTIFTCIFSVIYGSYSFYALWQAVENATQMWVLPALLLNTLLLVLKFVTSCILSAGTSSLCSSVAKSLQKSCKDGQQEKWFNVTRVYEDDPQTFYNGKHYHTYLTTAQSASWFCVFEWFLLVVLSALHYRRNTTLRSEGGVASNQDATKNSQSSPFPSSFANPNYDTK